MIHLVNKVWSLQAEEDDADETDISGHDGDASEDSLDREEL